MSNKYRQIMFSSVFILWCVAVVVIYFVQFRGLLDNLLHAFLG